MKYPQVVSMPSTVSNWLDEQLEARGIEAVVYTRYILSLLHSHTVDVLHPEEDLQFSHSIKKEVRRAYRGYIGSHRSSADWWRHAHADAERIKRSAAVECLLSASEQNCEIESLVDELCEKLKEVNNESTFSIFNSPSDENIEALETKEPKKITPQELAEKYYAAFPPLCPQSPSESKLLSLIPKWRNVSTSSSTTSPVKKKPVKKTIKPPSCYGNRSHIKENSDTMKARNPNKPRFNCLGRTKNNNLRNSSALSNWDFSFFTNNKRISALKHKDDEQPQMQQSTDQCVENNKDIWNNEDEFNMYDDLPVDIKDLLDSPTPHDDTVEMMNLANMRDTGKRRFIPYGTNIISSIWSTDQDITYDNNFNSAVDPSNTANEFTLDFKFSSISIDNPTINFDDWPPANSSAENETNFLFENNKKCRRSLFLDGFHSLPWNVANKENEPEEEEVEEKECFENEKLLNHLAFSLMKLNHNKEKSGFIEVTPKSVSQPKPFNPFGKLSNNAFSFDAKFSYEDISDKEDLLTSERSHFKPILEKREKEVPHQSKYPDGSTFVICNNFEKIEYQRSESGTMWLETEVGQSKKYFQYKNGETTPSPDCSDFVLKFSICQNDKACQTEESNLDFETVEFCKSDSTINKCETPNSCIDELPPHCTCPEENNTTSASNKENSLNCPLHTNVTRPESMLSEVIWKYEEKKCQKCHGSNNTTWSRGDWSTKGQMDSDWDENGLRSIWSGGEVCQKCLTLNGSKLTRPAPNHQLREDISQDGEQLLSDLSTIQKSYMDDLPYHAEHSLDISELISSPVSQGVSKERKRRHSLIIDYNPDSWSFASRLEEDCLMQMAGFPASRAVTL